MPTRDPYPTSSPNPPPPPAPLGPCAGWGQTHRVYPTIRGVYPSSSQIPDTRTPQVTPPPSSLPPPGGGGSGATSSPAPAPPLCAYHFFPQHSCAYYVILWTPIRDPYPTSPPAPAPLPLQPFPGGHHGSMGAITLAIGLSSIPTSPRETHGRPDPAGGWGWG